VVLSGRMLGRLNEPAARPMPRADDVAFTLKDRSALMTGCPTLLAWPVSRTPPVLVLMSVHLVQRQVPLSVAPGMRRSVQNR